MYDLIIRNGTIIDGSGNPRYLGDVAVKDGRIEKLGTADNPTIAASANSEIDAEGKLIDVTVDSSSGYTPLDNAAIKAVREASPFPELSDAAREEFLSENGNYYVMTIPVKFQLFE